MRSGVVIIRTEVTVLPSCHFPAIARKKRSTKGDWDFHAERRGFPFSTVGQLELIMYNLQLEKSSMCSMENVVISIMVLVIRARRVEKTCT